MKMQTVAFVIIDLFFSDREMKWKLNGWDWSIIQGWWSLGKVKSWKKVEGWMEEKLNRYLAGSKT